jgi:hypothetical protein
MIALYLTVAFPEDEKWREAPLPLEGGRAHELFGHPVPENAGGSLDLAWIETGERTIIGLNSLLERNSAKNIHVRGREPVAKVLFFCRNNSFLKSEVARVPVSNGPADWPKNIYNAAHYTLRFHKS